MISETAHCLLEQPDVSSGIRTPASALQGHLAERLAEHAFMTLDIVS